MEDSSDSLEPSFLEAAADQVAVAMEAVDGAVAQVTGAIFGEGKAPKAR